LVHLWAGVDAGKAHHHCVVIDAEGSRLLSQRIPNDEPALLQLLATVLELSAGDPVVWATDLNHGGSALLIALLVGHGQDILYTLPINFAQAALGDEIEVPTVDGKVVLKVPAGTQGGKVFRLKDKGVPNVRGAGRGDQHVFVKVVTPTELSAKEREVFEQLRGVTKKQSQPSEKSEKGGIFEKVKEGLGL
jgi:DnaJ-class molecular chaperone